MKPDHFLTAMLGAALLLGHAMPRASAAAEAPWAYVIRNSDPHADGFTYAGHVENLRVVLDLLRGGCRVQWIDTPPEPAAGATQPSVRRGDYLVPLDQPQARLACVILSTVEPGSLTSLHTAATCRAYPLAYPRILVDAQVWASNYYWYYDTLLAGGFCFEHLFEHGENALDPTRHNLYVVPGGGGTIPATYNELLRRYLARGGHYLGSCWGCAQALYPSKVSYGSGNGAGIADARNNEKVHSFGALGGIGHIVLRNDVPAHPVMWGLPREIHNIYWNGPVMEPGEHATALASLVDVVEDDFRFHAKDPGQRRDDVAEERGKCLYLVSHRPGEGKVALFGNHPEASDGVNPFAAHPMGPRAVYNAILFLTAGEPLDVAIRKPSQSCIAVPKRLLGHQPKQDAVTEGDDRQQQAAELAAMVDKLLGEGPTRRTEDQRSGFYLLRLQAALNILAKTRFDPPPSAGILESLRPRLARWRGKTDAQLDQLAERLSEIDFDGPNRRSTSWHPIVCPVYERSLEATHLMRDLRFARALGD